MYKKVLVANRGLIQANCVRAIKELGAKVVVVFEGTDFTSSGVRAADEAVEIQSATGSAYLDVAAIVNAAERCAADAVHPGYGFLAQNLELATKLKERGIALISPSGSNGLASKPKLKEIAQKAGLAVLPGSTILRSLPELEKAIGSIGYPAVLKAVGGYGGRAIRVIHNASEMLASWEHVTLQCQKHGFTQEVFLEKYLGQSHHVEFPVLRDRTGRVLVLPEQECSVQRRFQKMLVESPSPALPRDVRGRLQAVIPSLVAQLDLVGFAAIEFLVSGSEAYFLEVNGYIQPSHSVTSMLTGVDLLKEQIRLHSGEPLQIQDSHVRQDGHVVGVYVSALDPYQKFAPSPGRIERFHAPFGEGISVQSVVLNGDMVSAQYDPMIAKLLVHEANRDAAIKRLRVALEDFHVEGIQTTLPLLRAVVASSQFQKGTLETNYLFSEERRVQVLDSLHDSHEEEVACLVAALALNVDNNASQILAAAQERHGLLWSMASRLLNRKKMEF